MEVNRNVEGRTIVDRPEAIYLYVLKPSVLPNPSATVISITRHSE